jgi:hypothetical protein
VSLQSLVEVSNDSVSLWSSCINGNEIVVMKIHSPRPDLSQKSDNLAGRKYGAHGIAKRVTASIPDGPQPEGEFVLSARLVLI